MLNIETPEETVAYRFTSIMLIVEKRFGDLYLNLVFK